MSSGELWVASLPAIKARLYQLYHVINSSGLSWSYVTSCVSHVILIYYTQHGVPLCVHMVLSIYNYWRFLGVGNTRWVSMDFHADIITVPVAVKVKAQYTLKPNFIFLDVLWLGGFQLVNRVGVRGEEDLIVWRQHYIYVMHNNSLVCIEFSCSRQLSWPISFFCAHAIKFSPSKQYCLALVAPRGDHKLDVATFLCGFNCHIIIYCHCVNAFAFYIFLNECIVSGGG